MLISKVIGMRDGCGDKIHGQIKDAMALLSRLLYLVKQVVKCSHDSERDSAICHDPVMSCMFHQYELT